MSIFLADSELWSGLYASPKAAALLDDAALIAAMVNIEAQLAVASSSVGLIPATTGEAIARACEGLEISAEILRGETARDGVPVPAIVNAMRDRLGPELGQWLHFGATSQDILDTATTLQVDAAVAGIMGDVDDLLDQLAVIAEREADTVMAARTRSQIGLPTTFGAMVATWGHELEDGLQRLAASRERVAVLSLHGAAGTDAAFGQYADALREVLADRLGLNVQPDPVHTRRGGVADLGSSLSLVALALGRIGADIAFLSASGIREVAIAGGGSSTMPQKSNPVRAEALQSAARFSAHLQAALSEAALHGMNRDGVAWALEWMSLRPLVATVAASAMNAREMATGLVARSEAMSANLKSEGLGPFSEAAVFELAKTMPRPQAVTAIKKALASQDPVATLHGDFPAVEWNSVLDPHRATGNAPVQARRFAASRKDNR